MKSEMIFALLLACGTARLADATEPESWTRDYNAARHSAYKYFSGYMEKYGRAIRIRVILNACGLKGLAAQVDSDVTDVALYVGQQVAHDPQSIARDKELSDKEASDKLMTVVLATQSLKEGYEIGSLEQMELNVKLHPNYCADAGKTYDGYLKEKGTAK